MADHGQLRVNTSLERLGFQSGFGVFTGRQLVVHPPDAVRLAVHEDGVAGVPVGVEEREAFGGQRQVDADVGNDEAAFVGRAFELQVQHRADAGARAIGGHQPVGPQRVRALGRVHIQRGALPVLRHGVHAVAPAQLDQRVGPHGIDQVFLQILLLQVDHGEKAVVRIVWRFHAEHALTAVKRVAEAPGQAVLGDAVRHAHLLQDLHGAAREHDGAAAFRHLALRFEQHTLHAVARQLQRGHQSDGAGPGDHHGVVLWLRVL